MLSSIITSAERHFTELLSHTRHCLAAGDESAEEVKTFMSHHLGAETGTRPLPGDMSKLRNLQYLPCLGRRPRFILPLSGGTLNQESN